MDNKQPAFCRLTSKRKDMKDNLINIQKYSSPCGELLLGTFNYKLCLCEWNKDGGTDSSIKRIEQYLSTHCEQGSDSVIEETKRQLDEYFEGKRKAFDLPLLHLGTEFQQRVWHELSHIAYGSTISYAEEAKRIGFKKAVRAVANANHANAISVIVPCHRVIGSNGKLVGYGGGLNVKRYLLTLEARYSPPSCGLFAP